MSEPEISRNVPVKLKSDSRKIEELDSEVTLKRVGRNVPFMIRVEDLAYRLQILAVSSVIVGAVLKVTWL